MPNYLPLSLLPLVVKTVESFVNQKLSQHIEDHQLLKVYQSGFHPNVGPDTLLVSLNNYFRTILDVEGPAALIVLDFLVAFDSVSHEILLCQLNAIRVKGTVHNWFLLFTKFVPKP